MQRYLPELDFRSIAIFLVGAALILQPGCSDPPEFRFNEVELVKQEQLCLDEGEHFDPSYRRQIGNLLIALFGTPDEPEFPFLKTHDDPAEKVLTLENLKLAAGPVHSGRQGQPAGLYREHCAQCHGITGDGSGPTAAFLYPYPRDFRMGQFKFKSTGLKHSPTDEDLTRILRNGIPGTAMPAFTTLSPQEIESLINYVKYLSIRGELERLLLAEVDSMDGDPLLDFELVDPAAKQSGEYDREEFQDQLATIVEDKLLTGIIRKWARAEEKITAVPDPPDSIVAGHPGHQTLIDSGRQLFRGRANCVQCHGPTGLGDGQNQNFDDWTNDWLKSPGVDSGDRSTYRHFLAAGAKPPRYISPRNLQLAIFRGGGQLDDIFRRIDNGIAGTPMPSAPTLSDDEVWALVAYVKNMKQEVAGENSGDSGPDPAIANR